MKNTNSHFNVGKHMLCVSPELTRSSDCPSCGSLRPLIFLESWIDRIEHEPYRLLRCNDCGVVSSEPRKMVGMDWYVLAEPLRGKEPRSMPENDWRFQQFFRESLNPGTLLDVGCGDGGFMYLARQHGWRPVGFDYDERVVSKARVKGLDGYTGNF